MLQNHFRSNNFGGQAGFARMRRKKMMLIGGSSLIAVFALLCTMLIYSESSVDAKTIAGANGEQDGFLGTVKLFAPRQQINRGTKIDVADLIEVHWPRDHVPEGAIRSIYDVQDMYATVSLVQGQPILTNNLSPSALVDSIAERLPRGYRAVTIKVDSVSGVEGWARSGAHVDVQLTYFDKEESVNKTRVVVEDAIVLSYGGSAKTSPSVGTKQYVAPKALTTATLAVAAKDSLAIQTATAVGRITLALRNPNDSVSQGEIVFDPKEAWKNKNAKKSNASTKGFAKFSDGSGNEKSLVLTDDGSWFQSGDSYE